MQVLKVLGAMTFLKHAKDESTYSYYKQQRNTSRVHGVESPSLAKELEHRPYRSLSWSRYHLNQSREKGKYACDWLICF